MRPRTSGRAFGVLLAALLTFAIAPAAAQVRSEAMSEAELRRDFIGARLDGHYPGGREWTEEYRPDGTIDYAEGLRGSPGRWTIEGHVFCTFYDRLPGGCWYLRKVGDNCFEFHSAPQRRGRGALSAPPALPQGGWGARAWRRDRPATCSERPAV